MPPETTTTEPAAPESAATFTTTDSGGVVTRTDGTPTGPNDWRATLPPELAAEPSLGKYKSMEEAARGFVEAQKLVGQAVRLPKADAKPEEVAEFHRKLGVPESPDKYELTLPPLPQGLAWHPEQLASFRQVAHQAGITPQAAQALIGWYTDFTLKARTAAQATEAQTAQAERAEAVKALEQKWGPQNGPIWKHRQGMAEAAIRTLMAERPTAIVQRLIESANDPEVAEAFAELGDTMLPRGYLSADDVMGRPSADAALAEADAIAEAARKDPTHPLKNESHPDHARTLQRYEQLLQVIAGPDGRRIVAEVTR